MIHSVLDVIVVGAGQAGLTSSYYLKKNNLSHIVFEKGKIAESWISQRWYAFWLTSPNCYATLPGDTYEGDEPESHQGAPAFAAYLTDYVYRYQLPVRENAKVTSVTCNDEEGIFYVAVSEDGCCNCYRSRQVIIASGSMNLMKIPTLANKMPSGIRHLHAGAYRHPAQLPEGAVLVIGSAQSGSQIAEDLNNEGRKVYLSTSFVGRIPAVYRGKDIYHWVIDAGFFGVMMERYGLKPDFNAPPSISLQALAKRGVTLLGRLENVEGHDLHFQLDVAEHIKYADDFSAKVKAIIDEYIIKNEMLVPLPDFDGNDATDQMGYWDPSILTLNLTEQNIRSVVWACGFSNDYNYIQLPILTGDGYPKHHDGLSKINGLYFPGLYGGSSIHGIGENVRHIMEQVYQYAGEAVK